MSDLIERKEVIEITAETGALETQARVKRLPTVNAIPVEKVQKLIGELQEFVEWENVVERDKYADGMGRAYQNVIKSLVKILEGVEE